MLWLFLQVMPLALTADLWVEPPAASNAPAGANAPASPPAVSPNPYSTTVYSNGHHDGAVQTQRALDRKTPGFAQAIAVAAAGPYQGDQLADLLSRTAGVSVRGLGGLGQFSAIGLRGSSPQQVRIFVDGVPQDGAMAGLADLSTLPLDGVDTVEIYRGFVPIEFGGAAIGGALHLLTDVARGAARAQIQSGVGSFGTREIKAQANAPLGHWRMGLDLSYAGSDGDYTYFNDNGTISDRRDDHYAIRQNNGYNRYFAQVRTVYERDAWSVSLRSAVLAKHQEIPGTARNQSTKAAQDYGREHVQARVRRRFSTRPGSYIEWIAALAHDRRHFHDPLGEVGIARDNQRTQGGEAYLATRLRWRLWEGGFLGVRADGRIEGIAIDEKQDLKPGTPVIASGDANRRRQSGGVGLELEQFLAKGRIHLVPAVRVDGIRNRFAVPPGQGELDDEGRNDLALGWSPRLGTRIKLVGQWLQLRASVGRYFRPPTLMELFGDRGYIVGNEGLRNEDGESFDAGLVVQIDRGDAAQVQASAAAFANWSHNLIHWLAAGPVIRPANLHGARTIGGEGSLAGEFWHKTLRVQASYTFLDTYNLSQAPAQHGKALPGRPRHDVYARTTVGIPARWRPSAVNVEIFANYEGIAGNFLDPSGRYELPPRHLLGLGLAVDVPRWLSVQAEVRNFTNIRHATINPATAQPPTQTVPVADYLGYPLPGRAFWVSVRFFLQNA